MQHNLRVGGLTPLTSIDYPGELAAVIFCQGCPWRCGYCHNGHLLPNENFGLIDWPTVIAFLNKRRGLLDAVVFSGGEPTSQNELPNAIAEVKSLGYKVGLHTAGCYPDRLKKVLSNLDWVALDIKASAVDYRAITQVPGSGNKAWESLDLILQSGIEYEIRTTRMPTHTDKQILNMTSDLVARGVQRYALQKCRPGLTLDPHIAEQPIPTSPALLNKLENSFTNFIYRS